MSSPAPRSTATLAAPRDLEIDQADPRRPDDHAGAQRRRRVADDPKAEISAFCHVCRHDRRVLVGRRRRQPQDRAARREADDRMWPFSVRRSRYSPGSTRIVVPGPDRSIAAAIDSPDLTMVTRARTGWKIRRIRDGVRNRVAGRTPDAGQCRSSEKARATLWRRARHRNAGANSRGCPCQRTARLRRTRP